MKFESFIQRLSDGIGNLLKWALGSRKNKLMSIGTAVVLFVASIMLLSKGYIASDFFPSNDKSEFLLQLELNKDASLEQTNFMTQQAEAYLAKRPEITRVITTVGQASDGMMSVTGTKYKSEMQIFLDKKHIKVEPTKVYAAKLIRDMEKVVVGAKVKTVNMGLMGAEQAPLKLTVIGATQQDAMEFATKIADQLRKIPGATGVKLTSEDGNPEVNVKVDRDKMASLGLNIASVGMSMQTAFAGNTKAKYRAGDKEYDINIRYDEMGRASLDDVKNLEFINSKGQVIKLSQFADVTNGSGPTLLERRDKSPSVSVEGQTVGKPVGTVAAEWEAMFKELPRKPGVTYVWGGNMENQKDGFGSLGIALLASVLLVYLVMVALYDNFATPFVVLFSIPLSFIGALLFLALFNQTLNIFTILGIIMLIGLVAKNAIMLVDFANHEKANGASTYQALIAANHARFRPILMTTIAMVIGM
ncbi:MAG TPA: efflux RND transporter permease subunit, partial [Flavipsychrobacter sp.]|nr:efflux RND transporter permease subunit [Flavipsychrobacter sp.]